MRLIAAQFLCLLTLIVPNFSYGQNAPVVVELFSSQGCSSCPPADEYLVELAQKSDIIALGWHVDYWDYIGWEDVFAHPAFTERQKAYARALNERMIYTPQFIVNGVESSVARPTRGGRSSYPKIWAIGTGGRSIHPADGDVL